MLQGNQVHRCIIRLIVAKTPRASGERGVCEKFCVATLAKQPVHIRLIIGKTPGASGEPGTHMHYPSDYSENPGCFRGTSRL